MPPSSRGGYVTQRKASDIIVDFSIKITVPAFARAPAKFASETEGLGGEGGNSCCSGSGMHGEPSSGMKAGGYGGAPTAISGVQKP